ncbi:MAG: type II toxin-antitoxin system HicA family toxin [Verrucomicrobia bacterium]|nr:type II toxin-antitoxin system HicA family toxin [Verrucomicrobiota bacterium]
MAAWKPIKRREFIRRLRALGFAGPYSGTRHQFLVLGQHRQTIPSNAEYSVPQLRMLMRQVEAIMARKISADEWEALD